MVRGTNPKRRYIHIHSSSLLGTETREGNASVLKEDWAKQNIKYIEEKFSLSCTVVARVTSEMY